MGVCISMSFDRLVVYAVMLLIKKAPKLLERFTREMQENREVG